MGDARVRVKEKLESWAPDRRFKCNKQINGAGGSVTVVANPGFGGVRCPVSVSGVRPWRPWRAIDGTVRGPPLKRRCARALRRDRSLRAWRDRCF